MILYLVLFSARYVWESALNLANQRFVRSRRDDPPRWAAEIMDRETYSRSIDYTFTRSRFSLLSDTFGSFFLLAIVLTGTLGTLDALVRRLNVGFATQGVLFYFLIAAGFGLFSLPFSLYRQFVIEEHFGFNRMTWRLFFLDALKGLAVSAALLTPVLYGLFMFMAETGRFWWIYAFCALALFQLVITVIYPSLIAPLFNRFSPLPEGELRDRINALAVKLGFRTRGIYVMDGSRRTKHANAYFTGLGRAKRIVLFDTLINQMEQEEIVSVLAHEIAHEKKKHTIKRLAVNAAASLLAFWILSGLLTYSPFFEAFGFEAPSYHAALVLISFCAGPFVFFLQPLFALWSRKHEYEADRFAVEAVGDTKGLRGALTRLSRNSLANLTPHPWYSFYHYSHPTLGERIAAMQSSHVREETGKAAAGAEPGPAALREAGDEA